MNDEKKLHVWLEEQLRPCDYQRIEGAFAGVPDVNILHQGREVWCELKMYVNNRVLLRKEQYAWGIRRANHGKAPWIIAHNQMIDYILLWRYHLDMEIEMYGKYISLLDVSAVSLPMRDIRIKTILFPPISN